MELLFEDVDDVEELERWSSVSSAELEGLRLLVVGRRDSSVSEPDGEKGARLNDGVKMARPISKMSVMARKNPYRVKIPS